MREIVVIPELLEAVEDALAKCDEANADLKSTALEVYLRMEEWREAMWSKISETVH